MKRHLLCLTFCYLFHFSTSAQNLESIGKEKPFTLGGGLALNQIFAFGEQQSGRDPYSYVATGNLNIALYGWTVPLSFVFSNEKFTYQQPFNQYSLHPTYKWFTGHFGYTSVNFSPYTVNGHLFLGAAADCKPGKWNVTSFYGRFLKESAPDSSHNLAGTFERWGYGIRSGYEGEKTTVALSLFKASDRLNDFNSALLENGVTPMENVAVGLELRQSIAERVMLQVDWGGTAITNNLLAARNDSLPAQGDFFNINTSTGYYHALKGAIVYSGGSYSIGTVYERIDPGYRTLGAYYFNNDLENISVTGSLQLLENKLTVAASSGFQHDNLDNKKASTLRRWVGSVNVNVVPSEQLNVQGNYSNFTSYTNIRSPFLNINQTTPYSNLDTLNYTQLSQSASVSLTYNFNAGERRMQSVMLSGNAQNATDKQGGETSANSGSEFYNSLITYMVAMQKRNVSFSLSFNYSRIQSAFSNTDILGPVVSMSKMLLDKKLRLNGSAAWNTTMVKEGTSINIYTSRLNASYRIGEAHQLQLSTAFMKRNQVSEMFHGSSNTTVMLSYNYNF